MSIPRPRPKLMVIGDSLAQGCRSLSVTQALCAQSWPARVAQTQGWEFVTPDFPRPILFDLEAEIRRLDTLTLSVENLRFEGFESRIRQNLGDWLTNAVESSSACFDNLALAGALIYDLYTRTETNSVNDIASLTPQGANTKIPLAQIGNLHIAINGRFVLNPSQDPAFAEFTQLDWVRERKPDQLVVQIGHNHGLYTVGSQAQAVPIDQGDETHGSYWDQWSRLAMELATLPPEIGGILVSLLPKVGAVANLRALGTSRTNGYADSYEPVFSTSTDMLPGEALADVDANIRKANDRIRKTVTDAATMAGTAGRVKFLDLYTVFEGFDYKNSLDQARQVTVDAGLRLDNRYIESALDRPRLFSPFVRRLVAGGFQSADGMHPSGAGYTLLASEAMKVLGLPYNLVPLLRQGFAEDPLLSSTPGELGILIRLLGIIRDAERLNHFIVDHQTFMVDGLHLTDILGLMQKVFQR